MLLHFDRNGALKEILDYGSPARTGTTNFKIIAHFEDTNLITHNVATIKFIKPDMNSTQYPLLFMIRNMNSFVYDEDIGGESEYFQDGETYPVFEFDFANFSSEEDLVLLLDTPGLWKAIISLYENSSVNNNQVISVQGVATFNVQRGAYNPEEGTEIDIDLLMNIIAIQLDKKANIIDTIIFVNELPESGAGYDNGQALYNREDNQVYLWIDNDFLKVSDYVSKEYVQGNFVRKYGNVSSTTLAELHTEIGNEVCTFSYGGVNYLGRVYLSNPGVYTFTFVDVPGANRYTGTNVSGAATLTNIFSNLYNKPFATKEYVDNNFTKKFPSSATSGLTSSSTLNDLYAIIGDEPCFAYIPSVGWCLCKMGKPSGFTSYWFEFIEYGNDNTYRYVGNNVGGSNTLSTIFNTTGSYCKPYATKGYVDDKLYVYQVTASIPSTVTIDGEIYNNLVNSYYSKIELTVAGPVMEKHLFVRIGDPLLTKAWLCVEENHIYYASVSSMSISFFDRGSFAKKEYVDTGLATKQETLVSGSNIKTINHTTLLGSGNINIEGSSYNAGEGIEIENNTISIDTDVVATKDFVNSSIATETATFRGTYNIVTDLGLTTSATEQEIAAAIATKLQTLGVTYDNNDYVYVAFPNATVSTQFDKYDRYKFNAALSLWQYEYTLNNSSFTAEQWAAINSGITSGILSGLATKAEVSEKANLNVIADEYSNSSTYQVGDYCTYEGALYRCTTAITTAEDFDISHWSLSKVSSDFVDLNSDQTISGDKTFSNGVKTNRIASTASLTIIGSGWVNINGYDGIRPSQTGKDIGSPVLPWKNIYFTGYLSDGNNANYGLTLPDTTNFTANSELLDTASAQTVTGQKTITDKLYFINSSPAQNIPWYFINNAFGDFELYRQNSRQLYFNGSGIIPNENNTKNLGQQSRRWKDLYLAGALKNGSETYGLTLPNMTNWTANKEIATTDQAFNVINASDITVSGTNLLITEADYNKLLNGKPTRISGSVGGYSNPIISSVKAFGNLYIGTYIAYKSPVDSVAFVAGRIVIDTYSSQYRIRFDNNVFEINTNSEVIKIKGKDIPAYPSSPTTPQAFVYDTDNTLKYKDWPINEINASDIVNNTLTQAQYDLITNGKPTLIKGGTTNKDLFLYPGFILVGYYYCRCEYINSTYSHTITAIYRIDANSKTVNLDPLNRRIELSQNEFNLVGLTKANGKTIPTYPTTNTNPQYLQIAANGGSLSWADIPTTSYVAGTGISIASNTISVDSSVVALQSDLPTGEVDINFNDTTTTTTSTVALSNIVVGTTKYTVTAGMTNPMTTSQDIIVGGSSGTPTRLAKGSNGDLLRVNGSGNLAYGKGLPYIDCTGANPTYPSANNTDGLIIVLCSAEPSTKYEGYIYIVKAASASAGYSGNITASDANAGISQETYIKFDSAPTSYSDYDFYCTSGGYIFDRNGLVAVSPTYTNKTKVYVWTNSSDGGIIINSVTTEVSVFGSGNGYSNAVEVALTGNYDIAMIYSASSGGGSND